MLTLWKLRELYSVAIFTIFIRYRVRYAKWHYSRDIKSMELCENGTWNQGNPHKYWMCSRIAELQYPYLHNTCTSWAHHIFVRVFCERKSSNNVVGNILYGSWLRWDLQQKLPFMRYLANVDAIFPFLPCGGCGYFRRHNSWFSVELLHYSFIHFYRLQVHV